MKREEVLKTASEVTCVDREQEYGSPEENFNTVAKLWSTYKKTEFSAHDVAMMMILIKVGRIATGTPKLDNYVDIAGYAACAGEIGKN